MILEWWKIVKAKGKAGLTENLKDLDPEAIQKAIEMREKLGNTVEDERMTSKKIKEIAENNGWSISTAERWVLRFRISGFWGLTSHGSPLKKATNTTKRPVRMIGTLTEDELNVAIKRRDVYLGPLANKQKVPNAELKARALELQQQGHKISPSQLRKLHTAYKDDGGLAALADKKRSDRGSHRAISDEMVDITKGITLSNKDG